MADSKTGARPDPVQRIDSAFFWDACKRGELVAQECGGCSKLWHPPRPMCPNCHSTEKRERKLSGKGKIMAWTIPVHPPAFGFAAPPVVALVELEEGLRMISNIEGGDPRSLKIGDKVTVAFAPTSGGHAVPVFKPAKG